MLKVAIVGCGKIADSHASQIQRIKNCEIVGVCDREPLMARQLSQRFPVKQSFSDLTRLLEDARPDVVHITTPPQSHFDLAKACLEHGCHVYVEKPFTLYYEDAQTLIAMAERERPQNHRWPRRSIYACSAANARASSERISRWRSCTHGKLLLLRIGEFWLCRGSSRR